MPAALKISTGAFSARNFCSLAASRQVCRGAFFAPLHGLSDFVEKSVENRAISLDFSVENSGKKPAINYRVKNEDIKIPKKHKYEL